MIVRNHPSLPANASGIDKLKSRTDTELVNGGFLLKLTLLDLSNSYFFWGFMSLDCSSKPHFVMSEECKWHYFGRISAQFLCCA
jgi:hypothetical protein